ncbi:hypothetical protein [Cypionkella psychrotolerans]|uniref:hypothetical protein n=1 Tax=Cypionkella psychrotolerans TaxID=1678131 RepID=UPI0009ECA266|nr:hypothetical protein [Cypionkella psychrotolerans]
MIAQNVSQQDARRFPEALRRAQAAIHLPEVQDMLRRLSAYELGIFMPHMHDALTGDFQPLPDDMMQVESGLDVSFRPSRDIAAQTDQFLPTGWCWRAGAANAVAACEMTRDDENDGAETAIKHKMTA